MRERDRKKYVGKRSGLPLFAAEVLEDRRLLSAALSLNQSLMVFNAVQNSAASPVETLTLTNVGDASLSLTGLTVVNDPNESSQNAAQFSLVNASAAPASLDPGASFGLQVQYSANRVGLDYALLDIASDDPNNQLDQVQLHGIGTSGLGGVNQPSLERILQAYDEPNYAQVGESDPTNAIYPEPPASGSDEVSLQELTKAGSGPVTITVLASFTASTAQPYTLGWYNPSDPFNTHQKLFYTPSSESQSVYVQPQGFTSFDPGSAAFGFYNPSATVKVNGSLVTGYTQDSLNTWDTIDPRKFRFFPLKNSNGTTVANSYIMTSTEYFEPIGYDFTNIVAIVSNVQAAASAPVLTINNPNALPDTSALIFNRIQNPNPTLGDKVHDTNTISLENTGRGDLTVSNITVTATTGSNGTTQYQLVNPPAFPFTLAPGQSQQVTIQFVLSQVNANNHSVNETNSAGNGGGGSNYPGVLTITSNAANNPSMAIPLAGWWQEHSENENEPALQLIVNTMLGYGTLINSNFINFLGESVSPTAAPTYYGEEVVSPYWAEADPGQPVSVTQIDSFHTQGDTSGLEYYAQGSSSTHSILSTQSDVGQSFFPLENGGSAGAAGNFSTTGSFGFEVLNPNEYSDDTKNTGGDASGHEIRFYPLRDSAGNLVANTYLLCADYPNSEQQNFDFQDNLYLVTNIHPTSRVKVSLPQTTGGGPTPVGLTASQQADGVSLSWIPVLDSSLIGYNVYSSLSATSGYTLLTATPVTTANYLDITPLPNQTIYYRVASVDSAGAGLGAQTSITTNGNIASGLQSAGINEVPTGSTTTVTTGTAYTIVAGGPGVTGTSDGFRYLYAVQSGNFDVAVQVNSLTVAGNYATAGIMARDSLGTGGANVYISTSPTNYRFKDRASDGGSESLTVGSPVPSFPDVWVRLSRTGSVFNSYTSPNGIIWTLMQTVALANFPANCYLGLAVASNDATSTTTAQLTNYGPTPTYTGPLTVPETFTVATGQTVQEPVLAGDQDLTGTLVPASVTIVAPPSAGGSASVDPTTGIITYTPAAGFIGTETLMYTVSDSNAVTSAATTITFVVTLAPPTAVADTFQATAGEVIELNVLANDTDTDATINPATLTIVIKPTSKASATVDPTTGLIRYLASSKFAGTDTFSYTVADSSGQTSSPAIVTVIVASPNIGGIVTKSTSATAVAGKPVTLNVLSGDTDSSASLIPGTVVIASVPSAGGTAVVNLNGTITYTAPPGFSGTETFLYTVQDSAGHTSLATTVSVKVSNPMVAPIAVGASAPVIANSLVTVNVVDDVDSPVGLNLSTLVVGTAPTEGTTTVDTTTGIITYVPNADFIGADTFTYTVADVNGHLSNPATVKVNTGVMLGSAAGDVHSLNFITAGGVATSVVLHGGTVEVLFNGVGTLTVGGHGRATVNGTGMQISELELTGTTLASSLSVSSKRNTSFNIGGIIDASPLRNIIAPNAILSGIVNLDGVKSITVKQVTDAQITIGGADPGVFSMTTGAVKDSTLISTVPIGSISTGPWTSSNSSASSITAPSIGSLMATGDYFEANLTLTGTGTDLRSVKVLGDLAGSFWSIAGSIGSISANRMGTSLAAAVSGSINSINIRGGGFGSSLTASSLNSLSVSGGLTGNISAGSAHTIRVVGSVTQGASLNFTGGGLALSALIVTGSISGATLTTAGSVGSITAAALTNDTILVGATIGATLENITADMLGTASLNMLNLTTPGAYAFAQDTVIVHTLNTARLGDAQTANAASILSGIALQSAKTIVGNADRKPFRVMQPNTVSQIFSDFEIEFVQG